MSGEEEYEFVVEDEELRKHVKEGVEIVGEGVLSAEILITKVETTGATGGVGSLIEGKEPEGGKAVGGRLGLVGAVVSLAKEVVSARDRLADCAHQVRLS
jgi:hypothetical protein